MAAPQAPCPLLRLSDDMLEVVGHKISNALRPAVAGALAACNHNLWRVMRAPLAMLQPRHAKARALAAKVGWSCAEMRGAEMLHWANRRLDATDMATLAMLFSTGALARVVALLLLGNNRLGPAGGSALLSGLGCGDAPRLTVLNLQDTGVGNVGASALAAALTRGALPKLQVLHICNSRLGDEGLAALAGPLRRRPGLKKLDLSGNRIGDLGMAALVDNLGDKEFDQLETLCLWNNQIGSAGCTMLASALEGEKLPALRLHNGFLPTFANTPSAAMSLAAHMAMHKAILANEARRGA